MTCCLINIIGSCGSFVHYLINTYIYIYIQIINLVTFLLWWQVDRDIYVCHSIKCIVSRHTQKADKKLHMQSSEIGINMNNFNCQHLPSCYPTKAVFVQAQVGACQKPFDQ